MTEETIEHITGVIAAKGSDAWYQMPVEELLPDRLKHEADLLDKGQDTMDVWSDSCCTLPHVSHHVSHQFVMIILWVCQPHTTPCFSPCFVIKILQVCQPHTTNVSHHVSHYVS